LAITEKNLGVLYTVAAEKGAGKTAVCAGLAINLLNAGHKVAYEKLQSQHIGAGDDDINLMKKIPGLMDKVSTKDITLVEAGIGPKAGDAGSKAVYGAAKEAKARVIAVEAYSGKPSEYTQSYKGFGENLLGVIVNKVPQSRMKSAREEAEEQYGAAGIKVLGVIPENRILLAITIGELAGAVEGTIINNPEKSGEIIENYMLGAMVVDSGVIYFGRKKNKAAIIRQDRPDMQLAALETSTACLVLSGSSKPPIYNVLNKAAGKNIPVIATDTAVNDIVLNIEKALSQVKLNQDKKLAKLGEIVKQNLDMKIFA
jgi:BioD-like phosphotransacetylase family protein